MIEKALETRTVEPPILGRFEVEFLRIQHDENYKESQEERAKIYYSADCIEKVIEYIFKNRPVNYPYIKSINLVGVYYYGLYYDLDNIHDLPIDEDCALFILC